MRARFLSTSLLPTIVAPLALAVLHLTEGQAAAQQIIADHTTLAIDSIDQATLDRARALKMSFSHASVGENIWGGLTTLASSNRTKYAFPNWKDNNRGNPGWKCKVDGASNCDGPEGAASGFVPWVAAHASEFDVFIMKFCFIDQDAEFPFYRDKLLELEAAYPTKTIIWWTMPINVRDANNNLRAAFNGQVREYTAAHTKPLFDIADIESHDPSGNPVKDSGQESMYEAYSYDGGHLNATGEARMAKAMWWLMTRVANARDGIDAGSSSSGGSTSSSGGSTSSSGGSTSSSGGSTSSSGGSTSSSGGSTSSSGGSSGGKTDGGSSSSGGKTDGGSTSSSSSSSGSNNDTPGNDAGGCSAGGSTSPLAPLPFAALFAAAFLTRRGARRRD